MNYRNNLNQVFVCHYENWHYVKNEQKTKATLSIMELEYNQDIY